MIKHIHIKGLGPHVDTQIERSPMGSTEIWGPSEVGKSTLMDAVTFALYGESRNGQPFPIEAMTGDEVAVDLTLANGTTFRRVMTKERQHRREKLNSDGQTPYPTEKLYRAALGPLARADLIRLVMVPFSWVGLAGNPGKGRDLRNAIAQMLPKQDRRTAISVEMSRLGRSLHQSDPIDEKQALALRARANSASERLRGEVDGLTRLTAAATADAAQTGEVATLEAQAKAGRRLLEEQRIWQQYHAAVDTHTEAIEYRARQEAHCATWDAEWRRLGNAPEWDRDGLDKALTAQRRNADAITNTRRILAQLREAAKQSALCPNCGFDLESTRVESAKQQIVEKTEHLAKLEAEGDKRAKRATELLDAKDQHENWTHAMRALGERPTILADIPDPKQPVFREPTDEWVNKAKAAIQAYEQAEGARKTRIGDVDRASKLLRDTQNKLHVSEIEAERLDCLVKAIRAAPSKQVTSGLAALGVIAPVDLAPLDHGGIEIRIDGRPWWLASDGRQVVADARLRQGFRRALGLSWLPIFVDRIQAVAGQPWPAIDGPVIVLETTETSSHVSHGAWEVIKIG